MILFIHIVFNADFSRIIFLSPEHNITFGLDKIVFALEIKWLLTQHHHESVLCILST